MTRRLTRLATSLMESRPYNERRPHQALADRTPMAAWRNAIAGVEAVVMMENASAIVTTAANSRSLSLREGGRISN